MRCKLDNTVRGLVIARIKKGDTRMRCNGEEHCAMTLIMETAWEHSDRVGWDKYALPDSFFAPENVQPLVERFVNGRGWDDVVAYLTERG